jgi:HSP20 family molecular chaperone IbpA
MAFGQERDKPTSARPHAPRGPASDYELYYARRARVWRPPTDVYETDEHVVVKVEVPGMADDDFSISLDQGRLVITGRRQDMPGALVYHNMEIHYGEFRTEVQIDWTVAEGAVEATYERGFLYIRLPKPRQHRIPVIVNGPGD